MRHLLSWVSVHNIGTWGVVAITVSSAMAVVCFVTSHYDLEENSLVAHHGIFSPYSRRGYFTADSNGIAYNLIIDVDPEQSIVQILTGVGTLRVTTIQRETVQVPFVSDPKKMRAFIMAKSAAVHSTPIARLGVIGSNTTTE